MTREQCRQAARAITDSVNDPVLSVGVVPTDRLVDAARARNDPDDIDLAARVDVGVGDCRRSGQCAGAVG